MLLGLVESKYVNDNTLLVAKQQLTKIKMKPIRLIMGRYQMEIPRLKKSQVSAIRFGHILKGLVSNKTEKCMIVCVESNAEKWVIGLRFQNEVDFTLCVDRIHRKTSPPPSPSTSDSSGLAAEAKKRHRRKQYLKALRTVFVDTDVMVKGLENFNVHQRDSSLSSVGSNTDDCSYFCDCCCPNHAEKQQQRKQDRLGDGEHSGDKSGSAAEAESDDSESE